ncbi:HEPN domain-containing protein [Mitsuaria sp. GD03876]|uniref:HEPN domain-containing protein n=1 Tax=Mitsuaria sp. GD03876 TaxID=2975399 RepID=UPI0024469B1A|nr:HEPN domain-containing protein [Mitsuaria sp. GD03876]MDH0864731.1 HEPN domain-containing protein [Mitsuaria sp. GD03876]
MHRFDPDDTFKVAEHLMTLEGEGHGRSAASRAYYAVFLIARDMAGIEEKSADVHQRTQRHYAGIGEEQIAKGLRFLRGCRNEADYSTQRVFTRWDCDEAMRRSRLVRAALKVLAGRLRYLQVPTC